MIVVGEPAAAASTGRAPEVAAWDISRRWPRPRPTCRPGRAFAPSAGVIVYTSGTTGKSKGAHPQPAADRPGAGRRHGAAGRHPRRRPATSWCAPLYHSMAPAFAAILMGLGATVVLMNQFDPAGALDIIARERGHLLADGADHAGPDHQPARRRPRPPRHVVAALG